MSPSKQQGLGSEAGAPDIMSYMWTALAAGEALHPRNNSRSNTRPYEAVILSLYIWGLPQRAGVGSRGPEARDGCIRHWEHSLG